MKRILRGVALVVTVPVVGATLASDGERADDGRFTATEVREQFSLMSRSDGVWITSNEAYQALDPSEPDEYRMAFELAPDGYSIRGCMWGQSGASRSEPLWYLTHAWDPIEGAVIAYQSRPDGMVAIGRERPASGGGVESVQTLFVPGAPLTRVRHVNTHVGTDRIESQSFDGSVRDGEPSTEWTERRSYVWRWTESSTPAPCS